MPLAVLRHHRVALAEPRDAQHRPAQAGGGNMDIRDLGAGTTLYLPVEVAGALFSVGDTHATQGDGEVGGTAIESAMRVALTSTWSRTPARPFRGLRHGVRCRVISTRRAISSLPGSGPT